MAPNTTTLSGPTRARGQVIIFAKGNPEAPAPKSWGFGGKPRSARSERKGGGGGVAREALQAMVQDIYELLAALPDTKLKRAVHLNRGQ
ncbi:hypothetical protein BaRGS_00001637 [Batillaria attramentaria]|uniref:Uncharacterized protein n=1 Tax=Batillaria attramentaria TaxID=370345 RepID=A0ABD0M8K7_9CAEN